MRRLLEIGQDYIDDMKIRDVVLLKICLLALGIMLGCTLPRKWRKPAFVTAIAIFVATYIPLVCKLLRLLCPCCHGEE